MVKTAPSIEITSASAGDPWVDPIKTCMRVIQKSVPCDAMFLGLLAPQSASVDEVIACQGFDGAQVNAWLGEHPNLEKFTASPEPTIFAPHQKGLPDWMASQHAMVVISPEPHPSKQVWMLVLGRRNRPFNSAAQSMATWQLRRWQHRFLFPRESVMGRVLLGEDNRLIAADISTREQIIEQPALLDELVTQLHLVIEQRYDKLRTDEPHDFITSLAGTPRWVHFRRRSPIAASSAQWYIELRPIDDKDLPPVGPVTDARVAKALAFMHDKFEQTPSLHQIAKHIEMSPFHFQRLFTRVVGTSPKKYLLHWQLIVAKWLLRDPMVPIGSIASHTGFSSHGHFTATFHRLVRVRPTDYREKNAH